MTRNGSGSGYSTPAIVVWRSSIASSIALWVLALERLTSSSNTMLACTGPSCVVNELVSASKICVPMMSLGNRSGVHWMRRKLPPTDPASTRAAVVLARPGTLSSSR